MVKKVSKKRKQSKNKKKNFENQNTLNQIDEEHIIDKPTIQNKRRQLPRRKSKNKLNSRFSGFSME